MTAKTNSTKTAKAATNNATNTEAVQREGVKQSGASVAANIAEFRKWASIDEWKQIVDAVNTEPKKSATEADSALAAIFRTMECIEDMAETAPEDRSPYTCKEIHDAVEAQFDFGIRCGIVEFVRFYGMIYPSDRKTLFRLMELAGYIHNTEEMSAFKASRNEA